MAEQEYKVLESDEFGTLYSVFFPQVQQEVSVWVDNDGNEFYPNNFQGEQAQSIADMADYDWTISSEIDY
mgnify:CR=1 FL=1